MTLRTLVCVCASVLCPFYSQQCLSISANNVVHGCCSPAQYWCMVEFKGSSVDKHPAGRVTSLSLVSSTGVMLLPKWHRSIWGGTKRSATYTSPNLPMDLLKIDKYNSTPKASERNGLIVMCFISSAAVAEMCLRLRFIHAGLISSLPQSADWCVWSLTLIRNDCHLRSATSPICSQLISYLRVSCKQKPWGWEREQLSFAGNLPQRGGHDGLLNLSPQSCRVWRCFHLVKQCERVIVPLSTKNLSHPGVGVKVVKFE